MKKNPIDFLNNLHNWRPFKKELCDSCIGLCCYMPVEVRTSDLIRMGLLEEFHLELEERHLVKEALKHPGVDRYTKSTEKFTLTQKPSGSCYFLNKEGRCTIYEERPETCRNHPKVGPKPGFCAYYQK
jgi:Fe-S-cluster containining protein